MLVNDMTPLRISTPKTAIWNGLIDYHHRTCKTIGGLEFFLSFSLLSKTLQMLVL